MLGLYISLKFKEQLWDQYNCNWEMLHKAYMLVYIQIFRKYRASFIYAVSNIFATNKDVLIESNILMFSLLYKIHITDF